jgi:hypothetical protein
LLVTATEPTSAGNSSTVVDLTLTIPASFNTSDPLTPFTIAANTTAGNLDVQNFNGILNLTDNAGNISVEKALIFAGTCLQTQTGNVTIAQQSIFDVSQASTQVPCSNTTSSTSHPWFRTSTGVGNLDITLTPNSYNLLLDANTNNGKIQNNFGLNIPGTSGSATYHGPLLSTTYPNPVASLYVSTSTGTINVHKP